VRIRWSEPAELDLDDLFDYIARDAPAYAERFIDQLVDAVAKLSDQPRLGKPVKEARDEHIRELVFRGYRIIYMIRQHDIQILGVIHVRRDRSGPEAQPCEE
jgi:addiction module RelE/StbE family toxin